MPKDDSLEDSGRCLIGFVYTHDLEDTPKVDNNTNKSQYLSRFVGMEEEQLLPRSNYRNSPQFFLPSPRETVCRHMCDEQRTFQEASFPGRFNCQRLGTELWQRKSLKGFVKKKQLEGKQWLALKSGWE